MKILHIINDLNNGGAERLLVEVLPLLKEKYGIQLEVLQLSDKNSVPEYVEMLKRGGITVHSLTHDSIYSPKLIFLLRRFITRNRFDVIHVHLFPAMYYTALAGFGTQNVFVFTEHSTQNRRWERKFFQPLERAIYSCYHKIIAISPAIEKKLTDWTGQHTKIVLIRNGVDIAKFMIAKAYTKEEIAASLNINPSLKLLLMTARFIYPKDHITLIESLYHLSEDYHVLFAGGAGDIDGIRNYAREAGLAHRVHFLGFRNDIPQLMKGVDINILSSLYEGMSGVTCESLAAGKPFLGTDVPGINDVVPDERYLFEKQNPKMLAEKITEIISDPSFSERMCRDGMQFVKQFDMDIMLSRLDQVYHKAVSQK